MGNFAVAGEAIEKILWKGILADDNGSSISDLTTVYFLCWLPISYKSFFKSSEVFVPSELTGFAADLRSVGVYPDK